MDQIDATTIQFLLAYAGVLLNILWKLRKIQEIKKNFSIKIWVKKNWMGTLISVIGTPVLLYFAEQAGQLTELAAFGIGAGADKLIKDLLPQKSKEQDKQPEQNR